MSDTAVATVRVTGADAIVVCRLRATEAEDCLAVASNGCDLWSFYLWPSPPFWFSSQLPFELEALGSPRVPVSQLEHGASPGRRGLVAPFDRSGAVSPSRLVSSFSWRSLVCWPGSSGASVRAQSVTQIDGSTS